MTFAGKKLQDIYDSGASRQAQLESDALNKLKHLKEDHGQHLQSDVQTGINKVEGTASDLKSELGKYLNGSMERLTAVIEAQKTETKDFSLHLASELTNLSEKLKASIDTLKKVFEQNLDHLTLSASDRFINAVEHAKLELEKHDYGSSRHLKAHGTFISNSLQQKLDHVLWESRGDEKQVTSGLFKSYMQKANAIDSHFAALMQKMSQEFQTQYKELETKAKDAQSQVDSVSKSHSLWIDEQAHDIETQVSEYFKKLSEQHRGKLDQDLAVVADDLSRVHDAATEKLLQTTEQHCQHLLDANVRTKETLKGRFDGMKEKVDQSMTEFTTKLQERVKVSTDLRSSLESDRDHIVTGIRAELSQISHGFEKKARGLMNASVERVTTISAEAEHEIEEAKKVCDEQLVADGTQAKSEIENEVSQFLKVLGEHRLSALDEIGRAAGDKASSPPASSRNKKTSTKESGKIDQE